jgi:hypothetical protein
MRYIVLAMILAILVDACQTSGSPSHFGPGNKDDRGGSWFMNEGDVR